MGPLEPRLLYSGTGWPGGQLADNIGPELDLPAIFDQAAVRQTLGAPPGAVTAPAMASPLEGPVAVAGGVPVFHSNPTAAAKIIVDFDGMSAYTWGTYAVPATPAYDQDGDPTTFSTTEIASINEILFRVAEAYSPFNVDVTTEDTTGGTYANKQAVHVVVGGTGAWVGAVTGGVAFVGSFYGSSDNTAFVFPANLSNGFARYVAEAVAHEVGHTFGLQHQAIWNGSTLQQEFNPGSPDAAPLMGNSYSAQRALWWTGTPSSSPSATQDDLAILSGANNGFGLRADDYGNSPGTAHGLSLSGNAFTISGVITHAGDADWFAVTAGAGTLAVTLNVAQYGAMLDGTLSVYDAGGSLVASSDTSALNESLVVTLSGGTYYVVATGHGAYGDLGQYRLLGSFVPSSGPANEPDGLTTTPPAYLVATAAPDGPVALAWPSTDGATSYVLQRSADGGTSWDALAIVTGATTFSDVSAQPGTSYAYRIGAQSDAGTSDYVRAIDVLTYLGAPPSVTAVPVSSDRIDTGWDPVPYATGYVVERSTDGTNWLQIATVTLNSYIDGNLVPHQTYHYRIRTLNAAGASVSSQTVVTLTPQTPPGTPEQLVIAPVSADTLRLGWTDRLGNASGYRIEWSRDGVRWTLAGNVARKTTDVQLTGLTPGGRYHVRVSAYNEMGFSEPSATATAKTRGTKTGTKPGTRTLNVNHVAETLPGLPLKLRPAAATRLIARAYSTSAVQLTWNDNADAELGYRIEYSSDGHTWLTAGYTPPNQTGCRVTNLQRGRSYRFRVTAYNLAGGSVKVPTTKCTVPAQRPTGATGGPSADPEQDTVLNLRRKPGVAPGVPAAVRRVV